MPWYIMNDKQSDEDLVTREGGIADKCKRSNFYVTHLMSVSGLASCNSLCIF